MNPTDHRQLDRTFAGGVAWTAGVKYLTQIVTWGALIVTARLLSKEEFGASEIASLFVVITGVLAEFGIATAVLQMQELEQRILSQLHSLACLICLVACTIAMLALPLLTAFFRRPDLTLLFAVNNMEFLVTGLQAVPIGMLQRDLDYRRLSLLEATQVLIQSGVTVFAAWSGWGYWSLTAGAVCGKVTSAILVNRCRPVSFARIHWDEVRSAVRLGGQVSIGRLAWSAYILSDSVVIGRLLGDAAVGAYRMAMSLASAPAEKTSTLIMRAAGPLFAKVQTNLASVRRYYLILLEMLMLIVLPLMLGLALVSREAITVILGPEWMDAVLPLQMLALFMTLRPLGTLAEQVLISQRHTRFTMSMSILGFCVMPAAFYFAASRQGTGAVAAAWLVMSPVTILPMLIKLMRVIHLSFGEMLRAVWPAISSCAVMVAAVFLLRSRMLAMGWPAVAVLGGQVMTGGVVYAGMLLLFFRPRLQRYVRFAKSLRSGSAMPLDSQQPQE